jgi:hypothetical protein
MSKARVEKRSKVKPFIKVINYNHLMPTRYTLELEGLKGVVTNDTFKEVSQREDAKKTVKKALEERYTSGKNRWFFTPLSQYTSPDQRLPRANLLLQDFECVIWWEMRRAMICSGTLIALQSASPSHVSIFPISSSLCCADNWRAWSVKPLHGLLPAQYIPFKPETRSNSYEISGIQK